MKATVCDKNIYEITSMSIRDLGGEIPDTMTLTKQQQFIGERAEGDPRKSRISGGCGLEYLFLGGQVLRLPRPAVKHSGPSGYPDRFRISGGVVILDEPSIGLHQSISTNC